jgi:hypothetical protein
MATATLSVVTGLSANAGDVGGLAGDVADQLGVSLPSLPTLNAGLSEGVSAIGALTSGTPSFSSIAPLIGGALALTGVGAPAAALFTVGVEALGAIQGLFATPAIDYAWMVGALGFVGPQPYGVSDPKWLTWEAFAKGEEPVPASVLPVCAGALQGEPVQAYQWLPTIERDWTSAYATAYGQGTFGWTPPTGDALAVAQFQLAYLSAWKRAQELALNGYQAPDDYSLLVAVAAGWNASRPEGATLATFAPSTEPLTGSWELTTAQGLGFREWTCPTKASFVSELLGGNVDGKDHAPITIRAVPVPLAVPVLPGLVQGVKTLLAGVPSPALQAILAGEKPGPLFSSAPSPALQAILQGKPAPSLWSRILAFL